MSGTAARPTPGSAGQLAQVGAAIVARPYARRGISMSSGVIRIILVDDHAMVREGLRLLLRTAPDIAVVGEAADGAAAVDLAQRVTPDIVVLDLDMPEGGGLAALQELGRSMPSVRAASSSLPLARSHRRSAATAKPPSACSIQ